MASNGVPESEKGAVAAVTDEKVASNSEQGEAFRLDLEDALTPDPGTEDMFHVPDNKFAFSPGQLSKLFNPKSLNAFYALGGLAGLEKGLRTDVKGGLSTDEDAIDGTVTFAEVATKGAPRYGLQGDTEPEAGDEKSAAHKSSTGGFADRQRVFNDNRLPEKKSKTIWELAWTTYNDRVLILLTIAAVVSLALGLFQTFGTPHKPGQPKVEWVEGVAIMVAIFIVVLVGTLNDWQMERQFNKLNEKHNDRNVKVIRSGKSRELSVFDVMVGDVMHLTTGDMVPVDGIFINGHGVKCDESSATGESDLLKKVPADEVYAALQEMASTGKEKPGIDKLDPFIISGSKVQEGTGTFLVTAVGVNSSYGRTVMALRTEQEDTPLQKKLNILADWIAKVGGGAALVLFIVLFIKFCVQLPGNHSTPAQKGRLPLAVTLALAFATTRMMKDNNLVRVLKACETMGNATTVCSDKTGTLTQNKMTVVACTLGKTTSFGGTEPSLDDTKEVDTADHNVMEPIPNIPVSEFVASMGNELRTMLVQSNALNSTAFEGEQDGVNTFIGSKTEIALLTFSRDNLGARPVQEERSDADIVQVLPFDSANKYMATVIRLANGRYRVFIKGASEILVRKCSRIVGETGSLSSDEMTPTIRDSIMNTITSYAGQTLRTIASSYRDFESWPPAGMESREDPRDADFDKVHSDMTLIAIFGIKDPLRPSVKDAIKDCQKAGVVVRMVTGDNILTGRAIARECGIYHPEDGGIAMEGPVFRRKTQEELNELVPKLQVLARSSPEDKRILVRTLKDLGETVAVTGDGTNDAPALKMADIGFSMGIAGTEVAKEASSIILMDDNFASIVKGMMWGRAVNDSVKKFLQFQLTVNVTAVVLTFVSAVASAKEESVLNAVQLLWVNLIMDTFAALALATDPPTRSVLDRKPDRKSAPLITLRMTKMIIGQAICQLAITFCLNFGGHKLLGYGTDERETMRLNTLVFNTFVWLQIFNEINNRRLDNKLNILEGLTHNWFFIGIFLIMIGGQVLIIFVGGAAFDIVRLDGKEWGLSIGLGAISIPWGALIRKFPDRWIAAVLPWFIRKRWAPETITPNTLEAHRRDTTDLELDNRPPLRTLSTLRGERVRKNLRTGSGLKVYMHEQKAKAKEAVRKASVAVHGPPVKNIESAQS
ncbi:plasma membrane calcium [Cytospora paraplurivora]|uniref:Calcium-transporting ATPase n=1 Tax=Cytospora paraplurivora TaxID=2898453 RepID=A0AAN9U3H6_9PEZI